MSRSDWRSPAYWAVDRDTATPAWPVADPPPVVCSFDPPPPDAPPVPRAVRSLVDAAGAGGWSVRVGYSRGFKRGVRTGTYVPVETFGVWAGRGHPSGYRWSAVYQRATEPAGTWTWSTAVWRAGMLRWPHARMTDLKDFIQVRGSVLPSWFTAIEARVAEQGEKAKARVPVRAKRGGAS